MTQGSLPELAHLGGTQALTTTPVVGTPERQMPETYVPGTEELSPGEIRVTVLGSGDPWIRRSQASGSLLIEVGNPEKDFFFFDLGSGSLANFTALGLPVEATTKLFRPTCTPTTWATFPGCSGASRRRAVSTPSRSGGAGATTRRWGWPRSSTT